MSDSLYCYFIGGLVGFMLSSTFDPAEKKLFPVSGYYTVENRKEKWVLHTLKHNGWCWWKSAGRIKLTKSFPYLCEPTRLSGQVVRRRSRMQSEARVKTEDPGFDPPLGLILFSLSSPMTVKTTRNWSRIWHDSTWSFGSYFKWQEGLLFTIRYTCLTAFVKVVLTQYFLQSIIFATFAWSTKTILVHMFQKIASPGRDSNPRPSD